VLLQETKPLIVKIVEPKNDASGLADVLIGSLGLAGALVLLGVIAAGIFGGLLFWMRRRKPYDHYD
jgi:hypothetical protein